MERLSSVEESLKDLFLLWCGLPCAEMLALGANGSNRRYWRMSGGQYSCIGCCNEDVRENEAFFYYSCYFREQGIHVPELYRVGEGRQIYLQQDLGDVTLYAYLHDKRRLAGGFDSSVLALYRTVLSDLANIQISGRQIEFSRAYPREAFDRQSMQWDLNYFKYYFLKLAHVPFDEQLLEQDFQSLMDFLLAADCDFFMYRDFQSRNIMLLPSEGQMTPYYIDYQGGRRGAAQYDVASLLYSAKSDIPEPIRQDLVKHYVSCLKAIDPKAAAQFDQYFYGYVLIRILQAMGAYGYRGYYEHKDYFLQSIPLAMRNLRLVIENHPLPIELPYLMNVLARLVQTPQERFLPASPMVEPVSARVTGNHDSSLTVTISSFSFKEGLPTDPSGNGGGYVFDCRALPNPGRYPEYRAYTGMDMPVIEFLQKEASVSEFVRNVATVVGPSIRKYMERNFTSLMVSFGCTGGQHRSVYCAERLAEWVVENFDCHVVLQHREQGVKKTF